MLQTQAQQRDFEEKMAALQQQMTRLKSEKEQQQQLLAQSLLLPEDARVDAGLKHEITRLTNENLVRPPP